jgi:hypothetical protein
MNMIPRIFKFIALLLLVQGSIAQAQDEPDLLVREDFDNLDAWEELIFPKIEKHTEYAIEKQGTNSVLATSANASASGLQYRKSFKVADYPQLKWRWKVDNVYKKGNAKKKKGDDYPIRVYVTFKYDPKKASFGLRTKYGLAKRFFGEYPPHSSLNYIWANKDHKKEYIVSPYTDRSIMVALRAGDKDVGKWVTETVNIVEDYKKAFGEAPPKEASLAIMSDSDNTGEKAKAYIDFIQIGK